MSVDINGRTLWPGRAAGQLALLDEPLSLWGGLDLETGKIADATHSQWGVTIEGRVLAMPRARGSSSSSSALVEAARRGTAPSAILLTENDPILAIGAIVAEDLYGVSIPLVLCEKEYWHELADGASIVVEARHESAMISLRGTGSPGRSTSASPREAAPF
jgi:hypothetical protein